MPIHFLWGDEDYLIERTVKKIKKDVLKDDVKSVVSAFNLSIIALRNIKENLLFAFFYNLVMIPIAAGVFFFTRNEFLTDL